LDRQQDDYRKRVGRRIQRARKDKHWSQHQLAQAVDVQDNAVSRWENGRHMPSPPMLERIGNALGVPAESFLLVSDDEDEGFDLPLAAAS
jgi:transcriptional regulator with XRE-family HTH domain